MTGPLLIRDPAIGAQIDEKADFREAFRPRRYNLPAISYLHARADTFGLWTDYTAEMTA